MKDRDKKIRSTSEGVEEARYGRRKRKRKREGGEEDRKRKNLGDRRFGCYNIVFLFSVLCEEGRGRRGEKKGEGRRKSKERRGRMRQRTEGDGGIRGVKAGTRKVKERKR